MFCYYKKKNNKIEIIYEADDEAIIIINPTIIAQVPKDFALCDAAREAS